MDDLPDMQKHLDSMTAEEREEVRKFLLRFEQQLDPKVEQLLFETQDQGRLSDEDRQMRARLLDGQVPLINEDGELIYKPRDQLTPQDMQRFGVFMDWDAERRQREIGDLGESSEN
jgi:hypothetical protein